MVCHSRVHPSLFGEERHQRAAEIESNSVAGLDQSSMKSVKRKLIEESNQWHYHLSPC